MTKLSQCLVAQTTKYMYTHLFMGEGRGRWGVTTPLSRWEVYLYTTIVLH